MDLDLKNCTPEELKELTDLVEGILDLLIDKPLGAAVIALQQTIKIVISTPITTKKTLLD